MNIINHYRNAFGIYQQQSYENINKGNAGIKEGDFSDVSEKAGEEVKQSVEGKDVSAEVGTEVSTAEKSSQKDPVLQVYQEICERFTNVSFRLDDREESIKYQAVNGVDCCPYLGYKNSMNQVGEYFGEKEQKSVELDASVVEKAKTDEKYLDQLLDTIKKETDHYDFWVGKADEQGVSNLCVSIFDEGKGIETAGNYSNYAFSTEDQLKTMWSRQTSIEQMMNQGAKMKNLLLGEDF